jgi:hypothetical protein
MALCPECQVTDKQFFAYKCHSCNSEIGFFRQLLWQTVYAVGSLLFFGLILSWFFS